MTASYKTRYDQFFWSKFNEAVKSEPRNILAEFGCGPGLFLRDAIDHFKPSYVYGFDSSNEMLAQTHRFIGEKLPEKMFSLQWIDFDRKDIPIDDEIVDFAFSGFFLHEINHPESHIRDAYTCLISEGIYVVYDFVSGNKDAFIQAMVKNGMDSDRAEARYPHMCRHSIEDIELLFGDSGYEPKSFPIDDFRAIIVGVK
jgi:ubiquinone/menaquinone biosynthesis C-methylase UbiE